MKALFRNELSVLTTINIVLPFTFRWFLMPFLLAENRLAVFYILILLILGLNLWRMRESRSYRLAYIAISILNIVSSLIFGTLTFFTAVPGYILLLSLMMTG